MKQQRSIQLYSNSNQYIKSFQGLKEVIWRNKICFMLMFVKLSIDEGGRNLCTAWLQWYSPQHCQLALASWSISRITFGINRYTFCTPLNPQMHPGKTHGLSILTMPNISHHYYAVLLHGRGKDLLVPVVVTVVLCDACDVSVTLDIPSISRRQYFIALN